jgi:hypothetical protein
MNKNDIFKSYYTILIIMAYVLLVIKKYKKYLLQLRDYGKTSSNLQVGEIASQSIVFPSSPPKKSFDGFLGPKNSTEGIFRKPQQTPYFSVEYKTEGFGDDKKEIACPNCWGLFGGYVEENETPLETAKREMEEELGIKLKKEKFKFLLKIILKGQDFSVFSVDLKNNLSNLKLNEGQEMGLFSIGQIKKLTNITPSLIEILNKH